MQFKKSPSRLPSQIGPYQIIREIARGAMGLVLLAKHHQSGEKVALKVVLDDSKTSQSSIQRFEREIKLAQRLQHPHLVRLLDYGRWKDREYYAMEYIEGESLGQFLKEKGPLPISEALELIVKIARGVGFAHENNIIHRDLKPDNILLDSQGEPKVADFGLSKDLSDDSGLTRTGAVVGSPAYMSPEQIEGKDLDTRADIYALGVILFQMLTGDLPYRGSGVGMVYAQILKSPVPSLRDKRRDVPLRVQKICQKAMAKKKGRRYSTVHDFTEAIEGYLNRESSVKMALDSGRGESERSSASRVYSSNKSPLLPLLAGVGITVFLIIGFLAFSSPSPKNEKNPKDSAKNNSDQSPKKDKPSSASSTQASLPASLFSLIDEGQFLKALKEVDQFIESHGDHQLARLYKVKILHYLEEFDKAKKIFSSLSKEVDSHPLYLWVKGKEALNEKNYQKAEKLAQRALQKNSHLEDLHILLSLIKAKTDRIDQALDHINRAMECAPRREDIYVTKVGIHLSHQKDFPQAYETVSKYLKKFPQSYLLCLRKGIVCMKMAKYSEANRVLHKGIDYFPYKDKKGLPKQLNDTFFHLHYHLAKSYFFLKQYPRAYPLLHKALKIIPTNQAAYYWLGMTAQREGNIDRALKYFRKGWRLNWQVDMAIGTMNMLLAKKDYRQCVKVGVKTEKMEKVDHPDFFYLRGLGYANLKEWSQAREDLRKSFRLTKNPQMKRKISRLLDRLPQ